MFTKLMTFVSGLALCAAVGGCSVSAGVEGEVTAPKESMGSLTAQWTLDGSTDPDACAFYAVDTVDVAVFDDIDAFVTDARPFCEDFGVSFDLPTGFYSTELTLLDFDGAAVSDTIIVDADVRRDTETVVDVDFPDSSIF